MDDRAYKRKQLILARIRTYVSVAILVIILLVSVILVPKVITTMNTVEETAGNLNRVATGIQTSLEGVDKLIESTNKMVETNTKDMEDALNNFNSIDFDSLNGAIEDLASVVEPLARFTSSFR